MESSDVSEMAPESTKVPMEQTVVWKSSGRVVKTPARYKNLIKT